MTDNHAATGKTNVGALERVASAATGSLLILRAIRKPSFGSVAGALLGADLAYRGVSGHCQLYQALGVNTAAATKPGSQISRSAPGAKRSITIKGSPQELYAFWSDPKNLARIMAHYALVTPVSPGITHWSVRGPLHQVFEWDSQQHDDEPGHKLSWQTLPGTELPNRGVVTFSEAPNHLGSVVSVEVFFEPPLGVVGLQVAKALDFIPRAITGTSLRRFKSLFETGEIPTLEHNSSARGNSDSF